ncbi:MAG: rhomboid family intramembrane serine protease [Thiofilum sp.]|uniref:rhomboid family intramembrane serine protease n=1 Tax=Thiofilum sp. TaxID=2212733 RepID=UPI0025DCF4C0|nr:rhomboid family intramembrane serine protease [Thiofilum sp.]MBK8454517.1 rhomboid family intramembrane serine protease [Thiofilum sp.]
MNTEHRPPTPLVTYTLIALCVLAFIPYVNQMLPSPNPYALYLPANPNFHEWQYLSSMFMHGSWMHLALNMLGLWMFGKNLEYLWGSARFLIFYLVCGIGAGYIYNEINTYQFNELANQFQNLGLTTTDLTRIIKEGLYPANLPGLTEKLVSDYYSFYHTPTVGASGAIYGILAAYAFCFPNHKLVLLFIPYPIAAKYFVPILLLIDLFSGVTGFSIFGDGIAHFAHVGGAIVGTILVLVFGRCSHRLEYD